MKRIEIDYKNCLANLPNSILKYRNITPNGSTLAIADDYLKKSYKNVVVFLLDGMGTSILEANLKEDGFFRKHFMQSISSVFPPTTVAATTSVQSGLTPVEHAWLGWDCYFPQIDKNIVVFRNTEQLREGMTEEEKTRPVAEYSVAEKYCSYENIVDKILKSGEKAYFVSEFQPPYPDTMEKICDRIEKLCAEPEEKYIYAYWDEPDGTMHDFGCFGTEARQVLADLEKQVETLCGKLKDTLLIITADHGHIEGKGVCILDYPKILECLERMPSIEPRALNLFVKEGMERQFEEEFQKEFGQDYILLTKEEAYKINIWGEGKKHPNTDGMLGNYLAVATGPKTIFNTRKQVARFKGVHAGYTPEEMNIPFIVVER